MAKSFVAGGVAVITGGASGIGRAAAQRAAQAGMAVVLVDVNAEKLARTMAEIATIVGPDKVLSSAADVADPMPWWRWRARSRRGSAARPC